MINEIYSQLLFERKKKEWRKINPHNTTYLIQNGSPIGEVRVGKHTYGGLNVLNCTKNKLVIGSYCSIAKGTAFILGVDHRMKGVSTYPFRKLMLGGGQEATSKGDIIIGDDVWIGANVTILKGVNIGRGCVVAAGAVVISSFPAYCVVGGVPAHILGIRFNSKQVIAHEKILYPEEMRMKESELDYLLLDDDRKEKV